MEGKVRVKCPRCGLVQWLSASCQGCQVPFGSVRDPATAPAPPEPGTSPGLPPGTATTPKAPASLPAPQSGQAAPFSGTDSVSETDPYTPPGADLSMPAAGAPWWINETEEGRDEFAGYREDFDILLAKLDGVAKPMRILAFFAAISAVSNLIVALFQMTQHPVSRAPMFSMGLVGFYLVFSGFQGYLAYVIRQAGTAAKRLDLAYGYKEQHALLAETIGRQSQFWRLALRMVLASLGLVGFLILLAFKS